MPFSNCRLVAVGILAAILVTTGFQNRLSPEEAKRAIAAEAERAIHALKRKDMEAFASYIHPVKGVRFSPSASVAPSSNIVLTASDVRRWFRSSARRVWGFTDGTGAPIRMNSAEYYNKFVYNRDFANAPVIDFNKSETKSTDRNNVWEVYPDALVVEYYFPPSTPDGNDWASLRLVYEKHEGRWFLVGVIHDAWTI